MMVCGPTQSGKSTFTHGLLQDLNIFEIPPKKIYWYYGQFNNELASKPYITNKNLPVSFQHIEPFSIIVLDDLMNEAKNHAGVTALFTKLVHHKKLFVINITQNFYQQSKDARTRRLNAQYIVLFKNPADVTQVNTLSRQMFPSHPKFLTQVYNDVTKRPHGYLFIDLRQETPDETRIRSNILKHEFPMHTFNYV